MILHSLLLKQSISLPVSCITAALPQHIIIETMEQMNAFISVQNSIKNSNRACQPMKGRSKPPADATEQELPLCQTSELIGAVAENRDVTSCLVLKLFRSQMAGNYVTRMWVDCLANVPIPLCPHHLVQLCIHLKKN